MTEGGSTSAGASDYFIAGTRFGAPKLAPGLYVVSTPIGNLRDITLRALETLASADQILCEDTRLSARLLDHYGIRTRRAALHEHNERARIEAIAGDIASGKAIALISDAGTPLLSDPGFPLVRALREADLPVFAVPGPSALLGGLAIAGLPTDSFSFIGFLPPRQQARARALEALAGRTETLVFYESPRRLDAALGAMAGAFGETREAVVALELTKRFERSFRGTLGALAERFGAEETRGEAVIMVAGAAEAATPAPADWQAALLEEMESQPLRAAVDAVTARFGLKRKEVYDAALALKTAR
ncbi:16S rRNA (cytidine(1402)-2'-O)-methyltransferase [Arsenicitalea aurantiaca]|uniref:Ribosomal RNA small subunit methyltransferase I n=1 Tax=Arsenicitalea aurantiaca TaxID=1783274 RepID=A0A433X804_9HYPH|nr:16S rRNA (cytidine(1402)-2'-O)-methyltransferase [Arsenicitalea aurantiaca]RUT30183.1 16S rRNA (cytidine(1402)-2'-O)-methyltransferase [Arsenicitalea aurantiaca]